MRKLAVLLGIPVMAALIWIFVTSVEVAPLPMGAAPVVAEDGQGDPGGLREEGAGTASDNRAGEVQRQELVSVEPASLLDSDLYRIRVTNKMTGVPIPGAQVSYYERGSAIDILGAPQGLDQEARAVQQGNTVLADAEGIAKIPVEAGVMVVGRHEALYGEVSIVAIANRSAEEEYDLELERDLTVRVQVIDSVGVPVPGIGIGISPVYKAGDSRNPAPYYAMATTSAPEGRAVITHLQVRLRGMRQEPPPLLYFLQPRIPGFAEGGVSIDPEDLPEETIVFELPQTGRVLVGVMDAKGNKLPRLPFRSVRLAVPPDLLPDGGRANPVREWGTGEYEDGSAVFEYVVAGMDYYASASTRFGRFGEVFPGPRQQGDVVVHNLPLDSGFYALTGRILDKDRRPLADVRVSVNFEAEAVDGGANFDTDSEGAFWVYLRPADRDTNLTRLSFEVRRSGTTPLRFVLTQDRPLQLGGTDIGDVVLSETQSQLVGSGRVLVDQEPIEQWPRGNLIPRAWNPATEGWVPERNLRMNREADGHFEIHAAELAYRYRLTYTESSRNPQFLPAHPLEFAPGAEDLEFNFETPGFLTANVLTDGTPPLENLWLRLVPTDGQVPEQDLNSRPSHPRFSRNRLYGQPDSVVEGRQVFHWRAVWPGGYSLEVLPRGSRNLLLTIPNIRIAKGSNSDPRLDGIDLGGALREIKISVRDPDGKPIDEPLVLVQDTETGVLLQGYRPRDGIAKVLLAGRYLDLLVTAMGYHPKLVNAAASDTQVVLEPYSEILVKVAGGLPELGMGRALEVSVHSDVARDERDYTSDGGGGKLFLWTQPRATSGSFEQRNEVTLQFAGTGTYRLGLSVINTTIRKSSAVSGFEPTELQLRAGERQIIELRVPEEALEEALERVR